MTEKYPYQIDAAMIIEMTGPKAPFVIRGHHLKFMTQLVHHKETPSVQARSLREAQERNLVSRSFPGDRQDALDIIGDTEDQHDIYESAIRENAERFLSLSDDHPVLLVAGSNDGMCDACVTGDHCQDPRIISYDQSHKYNFYKASWRCRFDNDLLLVVDVVNLQGRSTVEVRNLLTTAGVVKQVLWRRFR